MNQVRNRVLSLVKKGAFTEAVTTAADFARRNPGIAECYALLAQAEEIAGYTKAAIKSVSKAIALAPQEPAYLFQRGRLYLKIDAAADALQDMVGVIEMGKALTNGYYVDAALAHRDEALRRLQRRDIDAGSVRHGLRRIAPQSSTCARAATSG